PDAKPPPAALAACPAAVPTASAVRATSEPTRWPPRTTAVPTDTTASAADLPAATANALETCTVPAATVRATKVPARASALDHTDLRSGLTVAFEYAMATIATRRVRNALTEPLNTALVTCDERAVTPGTAATDWPRTPA